MLSHRQDTEGCQSFATGRISAKENLKRKQIKIQADSGSLAHFHVTFSHAVLIGSSFTLIAGKL
jgi:hypothetical protein